PEQDDDFRPLPGGQLEARLERSAWVQTRPGLLTEPIAPLQRRRSIGSAVPAEEFRPIRRPCSLPPPEVEEADPPSELGVPGVPREQGARLLLHRSHDMRCRRPPLRPQDPLDVAGDR